MHLNQDNLERKEQIVRVEKEREEERKKNNTLSELIAGLPSMVRAYTDARTRVVNCLCVCICVGICGERMSFSIVNTSNKHTRICICICLFMYIYVFIIIYIYIYIMYVAQTELWKTCTHNIYMRTYIRTDT